MPIKKTTFTVPEVPGSKRISGKPYSHAIIGRYDASMDVGKLRDVKMTDNSMALERETRYWNSQKRAAEAAVGELCMNHANELTVADEWLVSSAQKWTQKYPTLDSYLAHLNQKREDIFAAELDLPRGELSVLRWSFSHENAERSIKAFSKRYRDIRVVRCVPVVENDAEPSTHRVRTGRKSTSKDGTPTRAYRRRCPKCGRCSYLNEHCSETFVVPTPAENDLDWIIRNFARAQKNR
jgi:hypothetical protein